MKLTATKEYHSDTPVSEKLASNFIELGYGLQAEGMAAEMFFNRSFEPFYPYRTINKIWFDLLDDENDPGSRCETDWRVFDWYHSSYEHNAWFAFPGTAGYQEIRDDSTFIIGESPLADVRIGYTDRCCHGKSAMRVSNCSGAPGGLAQDGKYCFPGTEYRFRGKILPVGCGPAEKANVVNTVSGSCPPEAIRIKAALFKEGTVSDPVCAAELETVGKPGADGFITVKAVLSVREEGRYTFALLIPPHSEVICDDFSLRPDDEICGFRKTAAEAAKFVSPKVIRWPGGCFASFYDWRKGVGPEREPSYSYFWGGYQYNDIGTDELAGFAEALGGESMICVNMHHPFKRFFEYVPSESLNRDPYDRTIFAIAHGRDLPEFTDREEGAELAAKWVEYCNGDETTEGGRARIANGRPKPYNVKYWEMDNEAHRWFRSDEYARECVRYSKAMKAADPSIRIGMISYCFPDGALKEMLDIAGEHIDFLADRGFDEDELREKLSLIKSYNARHGTDIKYCNTEWLPLVGADGYNLAPRALTKVTKCFLFSKWAYALDAAATLMMWQRYGEIIDFANFNNLANTHSQSVIETPKEGSFVTAAGMIMHMFANTAARRTLKFEGYSPQRQDVLQIQLSESGTGDAAVVNVLNKGEAPGSAEIDVSALGTFEGIAEGTVLSADSPLAMNRFGENGIRVDKAAARVALGVLRIEIPALSFSEFILPAGNENALNEATR